MVAANLITQKYTGNYFSSLVKFYKIIDIAEHQTSNIIGGFIILSEVDIKLYIFYIDWHCLLNFFLFLRKAHQPSRVISAYVVYNILNSTAFL